MRGANEVVILSLRCSRGGGSFGLRMEDRGGDRWEGTWTFKLKEGAAKREGYSTNISGSFIIADDCPGCPYCRAKSAFLCDCGTLGCCEAGSREATCPGCGSRSSLGGAVDSVSVGRDA